MESPGAEPRKTPASYADFSEEEERGGWLRTAVQFFAIPMLIVVIAVGLFLGMNLMLGPGPKTVADFVEMLGSDTVTRRWHAAYELSARLRDGVPDEFRDPKLVRSLCDNLAKARAAGENPPQMATTTLLLLARIGSRDALPAVRDALDDPHPWTRSYAVLALAQLGDRESAGRVEALAAHEDAGTRQAALHALATLEQAPGVPYHLSPALRERLRAALGDRSEDVRFTAAILLARVQEREAALPVLKTMLDRTYLERIVPANDVDTRIGGISRYELHGNVVRAALAAVEDLDCGDDPEVVAALERLADTGHEGDPDVRERARGLLEQWNA